MFLLSFYLLIKVSFNLDELRGCSPSLPVQVGTLELYANVPLLDYETLLDGVFKICYPRTLRVSTMFEEDKKLIEVYISTCIMHVS